MSHILQSDIYSCNNEILIEKLREGYNPNTTYKLKTLLHIAAEIKNVEAVKILLDNGADPSIREGMFNQSPIHTACMLIPLHSIYSISRCYNMRRQFCNYVYAPLERNIEERSLEIAKILLTKNPELINSLDDEKCTPLHIAAESNHIDMVKLLIRSGADINAVDSRGKTPLACAAMGERIEIMKELLQSGADVEKEDVNGMTSIFHALQFASDITSIELLINYKANVNVVDKIGWYPIHIANGRYENIFLEVLIRNGANIRVKDRGGRTLLHRSVWINNSRLKMFINAGLDVNEKDNTGKTPLHHAATHPMGNSVEILLRHGADVNAIDVEGNTPLLSTRVSAISQRWIERQRYKCIVELVSQIVLLNTFYNDNSVGLKKNTQIIEDVPKYKIIKLLCESEIEKLYNIRLCPGITAEIILTASPTFLARFIDNPALRTLQNRFKVYGKRINNSIALAKDRALLQATAVSSINRISCFDKLPEPIINMISEYLEYDDIMALKASSNQLL